MDRVGWAALAAGAAIVPLLTSNTYYLYVAMSVGLLTIVTAGLNVLVGFTGQTSLGHAGLYAFGAYTAALCATRAGNSAILPDVGHSGSAGVRTHGDHRHLHAG